MFIPCVLKLPHISKSNFCYLAISVGILTFSTHNYVSKGSSQYMFKNIKRK